MRSECSFRRCSTQKCQQPQTPSKIVQTTETTENMCQTSMQTSVLSSDNFLGTTSSSKINSTQNSSDRAMLSALDVAISPKSSIGFQSTTEGQHHSRPVLQEQSKSAEGILTTATVPSVLIQAPAPKQMFTQSRAPRQDVCVPGATTKSSKQQELQLQVQQLEQPQLQQQQLQHKPSKSHVGTR